MDLRDAPWAGRYGIVAADPPWLFKLRSRANLTKSPERHYACAPVDEIGALPVSQVAAPDAWLFLWVTFPVLAAGDHLRLIDAWGDPANPWVGVTGGAWAKRPRGWRGDPAKWQMGPGYIFRSAAEALLVYRRGAPQPWSSKSERNLWIAPIREHSRKPDEVLEMIDRALPVGPRLEMFSRSDRPGWDAVGDEAGKFNGRKRRARAS